MISEADARPTRGMTRSETQPRNQENKHKGSDRKQILQKSRKAAASAERVMARVNPIPRPDTHVDDSELDGLKKKAGKEDAAALIRLGHYYMMHPVENGENEKTAGEYFFRAAQTGDPDGLAWYALYKRLVLPEADRQKQNEVFLEGGIAAAQQGSMVGAYLAGIAVTEHTEEKMEWLRKAAKSGFVPAMRALGGAIADYTLHNVPIPANEAYTPEAKAWLKMAAERGDYYAWQLLTQEGSAKAGPGEPPVEVDYTALETYAENAIRDAKTVQWNWYGTAFDTRQVVDRYAFGGSGAYALLMAYRSMSELYKRQNKDQAPLLRRIEKELTGMADNGNTDAMIAILVCDKEWNSFFRHMKGLCPFDSDPYRRKVQALIQAGNLHLKKCLQHAK